MNRLFLPALAGVCVAIIAYLIAQTGWINPWLLTVGSIVWWALVTVLLALLSAGGGK